MKYKLAQFITHVVFLTLLTTGTVFAGGDYFMVSDVGASAQTIRMGNIEGFKVHSGYYFVSGNSYTIYTFELRIQNI